MTELLFSISVIAINIIWAYVIVKSNSVEKPQIKRKATKIEEKIPDLDVNLSNATFQELEDLLKPKE